jgi:hypothetical protein
MIGLVDLVLGLFFGFEFLRVVFVAGGDVEPEPLAGLGLLEGGDDLIEIGPTAAVGLTRSCE